MIGQYLVDLVDEAGYPRWISFRLLAGEVGAPLTDVEAAPASLSVSHPPGVCARNVMECLTISTPRSQLLRPCHGGAGRPSRRPVKRDLSSLRKICGVSEEDLAEMIAEIRQLNPKPGLAFGPAVVHPIVPHVFVRRGPICGSIVELNSGSTLPKLLVNQSYHAEVVKTARSDKDKSYLAIVLQTATWLVRALDQRAKTILKVATEIVRQQDGFFALSRRQRRSRMPSDA